MITNKNEIITMETLFILEKLKKREDYKTTEENTETIFIHIYTINPVCKDKGQKTDNTLLSHYSSSSNERS